MENPEFYQGGCYSSQYPWEKLVPAMEAKNGDYFNLEELLDFPNDDDGMVVSPTECTTTTVLDNNTITDTATATTDPSSSSPANNTSSSFSATTNTTELLPHRFPGENYIDCLNFSSSSSSDPQFTSDLCLPYDELAELEWLFEDSFSTEDLQKLQLMSGMKTLPNNKLPSPEIHHDDEFQLSEQNHRGGGGTTGAPTYHQRHPMKFRPETAVPAKARSKRSRAAPCNWTSRLLVVSPSPATTETTTTTTTTTTSTVSSSSESDIATSSIGGGGGKKTVAKATPKKKEAWENGSTAINGGEGRKCLHCSTDKTPQWRTGPMGPKTLCNACGVRYKSGRLVPEYRPAASPTFMLTKHSNSHRKVLELRKQKEMIRAQNHQQQQEQHQFLHQSMIFDLSNGDDCLIPQQIGSDFRQLI